MSDIIRVEVSSGEMAEAMIKMAEAVGDAPTQTVLLACLALVFTIQMPNITTEKLAESVTDASSWIAAYISMSDPAASHKTH